MNRSLTNQGNSLVNVNSNDNNELTSNLNDVIVSLNDLIQQRDRLKEEIQYLEKDRDHYKKSYTYYKDQYYNIVKERTELREQVNKFNSSATSSMVEIRRLKDSISYYEKSVNESDGELSRAQDHIAYLTEELDDTKDKLEDRTRYSGNITNKYNNLINRICSLVYKVREDDKLKGPLVLEYNLNTKDMISKYDFLVGEIKGTSLIKELVEDNVRYFNPEKLFEIVDFINEYTGIENINIDKDDDEDEDDESNKPKLDLDQLKYQPIITQWTDDIIFDDCAAFYTDTNKWVLGAPSYYNLVNKNIRSIILKDDLCRFLNNRDDIVNQFFKTPLQLLQSENRPLLAAWYPNYKDDSGWKLNPPQIDKFHLHGIGHFGVFLPNFITTNDLEKILDIYVGNPSDSSRINNIYNTQEQ